MRGAVSGGCARGVGGAAWLRTGLPGLVLCAAMSFPVHALPRPADQEPATRQDKASAASVEQMTFPGGTLKVEVLGFDDPRRVAELRAWLRECVQAMLTAYGRMPLPEARVRIAPATRHEDSPVPWGQTSRRDGDVAVLLYVRQDASLEELRADWTAVHELSHLFHPFLGDDGRWLAEGLASYYQNVLRARAGLLSQAEAWRRLDAGFGRGHRDNSGLTLRELARSHEGTMRVYWAGAAYWLETDLALRRRGSSLDAVLANYARCCLHGSGAVAPEAFIAELDRIAGTDVFASHDEDVFATRYGRFAAARTFPSLDATYASLGLEPQADGLRFTDAPDAVALRRAIMARPSGAGAP